MATPFISPRILAERFGYGGLIGLGLVAVLVVAVLHFAGLVLLGILLWLVCLRAESQDPLPPPADPADAREQRAAELAAVERARRLHFIGFYRRCAVLMLVLGGLGLLAQILGWLRW